MLPTGHRLQHSADFAAVARHGRRQATGGLVLTLLAPDQGAGSAPARVGFVVGRRLGSAVARNRLRRRLRALMSSRIARLPRGARVVIRALPEAARQPTAQLGADLDRLLDRRLR